MASAKKCDRCGKYYVNKPTKLYDYPSDININNCFSQIAFVPNGMGPYIHMDLCEDCMDDFANFLGVMKVKEDDE